MKPILVVMITCAIASAQPAGGSGSATTGSAAGSAAAAPPAPPATPDAATAIRSWDWLVQVQRLMLKQTCVDAMNVDPEFAHALVLVADKQIDARTVAAHEDAVHHVEKNERHLVYALAAMTRQLDEQTEPGLDEQVFHEPADEKWREAWEITDRLVLAANEETRSHAARFVLAVLSTPGTVYPDPQMRARYAESLGVKSLFYPEERLQRLGEHDGFDVLALAPAMQRAADEKHVFLHGFENTKPGFGHWNEAGHALAADLIAGALCARP